MKWIGIIVWLQLSAAVAEEPTAEQMRLYIESRPELDLLTWADEKRGKPFTVRFLRSDGTQLTVEKSLANGKVVRTLQHSEVGALAFSHSEIETRIHKEPAVENIEALRVLWETRKGTFGILGSNVADTGFALAQSLRLDGSLEALEEGLVVLRKTRTAVEDEILRDRAIAEELTTQFLIKQNSDDPGESEEAAWKITGGPENPEGMVLATAFLGGLHLSRLKALEAEHPRWMDDDEVKPERDRLHHLTLDFFVYPSLFTPMREGAASAGLANIAAVHRFTGSNEQLLQALEDLAALYPDSGQVVETAEELKRLKMGEAASTTSPVTQEAQAEEENGEQDAETDHPAPKRYNLFID